MKQSEKAETFVPIDAMMSAKNSVLIAASMEMKWLKCQDRTKESLRIA
jgi:hypothetical protein